ncbi:ROK family transcriptional regulator [Actinotalea caeni]|uniref:ROK family transcriptional regulator n=1 Tax=Actinotalea caeni TaxID=1348467 RepID=UPI0012E15D61|nr:ROK family transcriptional regulator [Actinotalea caeni]
MSRTTGSQSSLREANRTLVIETVKEFGGLTQVELIDATGLSAATVSTIVKELTSSGVVDTQPTSRSGRRAQMVTLSPQTGLVAGVHVARRQIRVLLGDFSYTTLASTSLPVPFDQPADTGLDRIALLLAEMIDGVGRSTSDLLAVGIACPAPVDATGMVSVRGLMPGWEDEQIGELVAKRLGCAVHVDNDANLGALAEVTLGASREVADSLWLTVSDGVGAGLVLGRRVHRGFAGAAGEIGHVQVDPTGSICRCGNRGCLETVVGAEALLAPLRPLHPHLTLRDLVDRAVHGDAGCRRVIADAAATIGRVVGSVCQMVNPPMVVVGGPLAESGEVFLEPLRAALAQHTIRHLLGPVEVVPSRLGSTAEVTGALVLAVQRTDVTHRSET